MIYIYIYIYISQISSSIPNHPRLSPSPERVDDTEPLPYRALPTCLAAATFVTPLARGQVATGSPKGFQSWWANSDLLS